jgi:hypothetical protein
MRAVGVRGVEIPPLVATTAAAQIDVSGQQEPWGRY